MRARQLSTVALAAFLALTTLAAGRAPAATSRFADKDFATPEAAAKNFAEGLAKVDVEQMLQSFAITRYADNFDLVAYGTRLQSIVPQLALLPSTDASFRELNEVSQAAAAVSQIRTLIYSLVSTEKQTVIEGGIIADATGAKTKAFAASLDPAKLRALKIAKIAEVPTKSSPLYARNQKNELASAKVTKADEARMFVLLYQLGSQTYEGGMTIQRWGSSWGIVSLSAPIIDLPSTGALKAATAADYDKDLHVGE